MDLNIVLVPKQRHVICKHCFYHIQVVTWKVFFSENSKENDITAKTKAMEQRKMLWSLLLCSFNLFKVCTLAITDGDLSEEKCLRALCLRGILFVHWFETWLLWKRKNHYGYSTWSIFSIGHLLTDLQRFYELIICITFSFSVTAPLFLSRVAEHKINLHFSFQNSTSWSKNMNKRKKSVIGYW